MTINWRDSVRFGSLFVLVPGLLLIGVWFALKPAEQGCSSVHDAFDQFTADRKKAPQSLEELVREGYLPRQPKDVRMIEDCVPRQQDSPQ